MGTTRILQRNEDGSCTVLERREGGSDGSSGHLPSDRGTSLLGQREVTCSTQVPDADSSSRGVRTPTGARPRSTPRSAGSDPARLSRRRPFIRSHSERGDVALEGVTCGGSWRTGTRLCSMSRMTGGSRRRRAAAPGAWFCRSGPAGEESSGGDSRRRLLMEGQQHERAFRDSVQPAPSVSRPDRRVPHEPAKTSRALVEGGIPVTEGGSESWWDWSARGRIPGMCDSIEIVETSAAAAACEKFLDGSVHQEVTTAAGPGIRFRWSRCPRRSSPQRFRQVKG